MANIKGPAVFLAQFMRDEEPFNSIDNISRYFAGLGYKGIQLPGWDGRAIDIDKAAESVHLTDWPEQKPDSIDDKLNAEMRMIQKLASLGHGARQRAGPAARGHLPRPDSAAPGR